MTRVDQRKKESKTEASKPNPTKLRILFVNDTNHIEGGAQIYLENTMVGLRAKGHAVYLVAGAQEQSAQERRAPLANKTFTASRDGYARYLDRIYNRAAITAIKEATGEFKPDIIHLNYAADSVSLAGMRMLKAPRVVSFHDLVLVDESAYGTAGHPLYRLYIALWTATTRSILRQYDLAIAPSLFVQRMAQAKGYRNCDVIPNGAMLEKASLVPRRKEILYVGKFIASKGVLTLLEAFAQVRKAHPGAHLSLVGDGPERALVLATIKRLKLSDFVTIHVHANRADLSKRYAAARIIVVPSVIPESFNLVRIEAMSAGRPVVLTPVGGMREGVHDGEDVIVLPDTTARSIASAVNKLLSDTALCARIGANAARTAANFSMKEHLTRLEAKYRELLS